MEYTFNGMVRYSYGFDNPNHAAALIAALIPLLFIVLRKYPHYKIIKIGSLLSIATLIVLCIMTFSRTGIIVIGIELILLSNIKKNWKWQLTILSFIIIICSILGVSERFKWDKSASNRIEIAIAGCQLFAANPHGVGIGNSGKIVSATLLPENINCRTLINSHLTFLCEYGWILGVFWFGILFYAIQANRHYELKISLLGLVISATISTIFDVSIYQQPEWKHAGFWLSTMLFALFIISVITLSITTPSWRRFLVSLLCTSTLLLTLAVCFYDQDTVKVNGNYLNVLDNNHTLTLYDTNYSLRSITQVALNNGGGFIALSPTIKDMEFPDNIDHLILFGHAIEYANLFPGCKFTVVEPPRHYDLPIGTTKVMLSEPNRKLENQATQMGVEIKFIPLFDGLH